MICLVTTLYIWIIFVSIFFLFEVHVVVMPTSATGGWGASLLVQSSATTSCEMFTVIRSVSTSVTRLIRHRSAAESIPGLIRRKKTAGRINFCHVEQTPIKHTTGDFSPYSLGFWVDFSKVETNTHTKKHQRSCDIWVFFHANRTRWAELTQK